MVLQQYACILENFLLHMDSFVALLLVVCALIQIAIIELPLMIPQNVPACGIPCITHWDIRT